MYKYLFECMIEWFRPQYEKDVHLKIMASNGMTTLLIANLVGLTVFSRHVGVSGIYTAATRKSALTLGVYFAFATLIFLLHFSMCPRVRPLEPSNHGEVAKRRRIARTYMLGSALFVAAVFLEKWI
jgi:hypothetical protein